MTTEVAMLPDGEIAKIVLGLSGVHDITAELTSTVLGHAQELAQSHAAGSSSPSSTANGHGGSYLSSLFGQVENVNGAPVGEVGSSSPVALIIEFGTAERETAAGANRGAMPAQHILQRAVEATGLEISAARK